MIVTGSIDEVPLFPSVKFSVTTSVKITLLLGAFLLANWIKRE